jgi:N utilization substance protein B
VSRRRARKQAFLVLYQNDVTGAPVESLIGKWLSYRGDLEDYARHAIKGVAAERERLDELLSQVSVGWPVHRMSAVDRTVLRLGLYEMLRVEDVPADVAVNEAVELAKGFSGEDSPGFVSGVLRGAESRLVTHG